VTDRYEGGELNVYQVFRQDRLPHIQKPWNLFLESSDVQWKTKSFPFWSHTKLSRWNNEAI